MSDSRAGSAMVAALAMVFILLLIGLQTTLAVVTLRAGSARLLAARQAGATLRGAALRAAAAPPHRLALAMADGAPLELPGEDSAPASQRAVVRVVDDDEADEDPGRDTNGRLLLLGEVRWNWRAGEIEARRTLVREALVGAFQPLPAAFLDCGDGPGVCGGVAGCPLAGSRLDGGEGAAFAVPAPRLEARRLLWIRYLREVVREADRTCAMACAPEDEALWRAAATAVLRAVEDPQGDAVDRPRDEVAILVAPLLALEGTERGPGRIPWRGGLEREVAALERLVAALESLGRPAGHRPSLDSHPVPRVLAGVREWAGDGGACARLAVLLPAAVRGAALLPDAAIGPALDPLPPGPLPVGGTFVIASPLRILAGEALSGEGLLILQAPLDLEPGAGLDWRGSVVLAGGAVAGGGQARVEGSLVDLGRGVGIDLMGTAWSVTALPGRHAPAWAAAGTVLLSSWEEIPGE